MSHYDPVAHAALICDWSLSIEPGDAVLVQYPAVAEPLALAVQEAMLQRGAWPALRPDVSGRARAYVDHAADEQLDVPNPIDVAEQRAATKFLRLYAPDGPDPLAGADRARVAQLARGQQSLRRVTRRTPWCLTIFPTPGLAERAELPEDAYADFVHRALMLDRPDPAGAWQELSAVQAELCERLALARTIRIEGEGTELELRVDGRHWQNSDGKRNLPSGEVFTGPRERSAKGVVQFDVPSYRPGGVVRGARLAFDRGRVVEARRRRARRCCSLSSTPTRAHATSASSASARARGSTVRRAARCSTRRSRAPCTSPSASRTPRRAAKNRSAVHWDLITDLRAGGRLTADGAVVMEDGRLV